MNTENVCRISFDGEMLGGVAGHYSLVEIGACTIEPIGKMQKFGCIIRPSMGHAEAYEHGSMKVLRRPFEVFQKEGLDPRDAAHQFVDFCDEVRGDRNIELHGVNSPFDFQFFREFLHRFCPDRADVIGYKAFDITSYACGVFGLSLGSWSAKKTWKLIKTHHPVIYAKYFRGELEHTGLEDAIDQARLLMAIEEVQLLRANTVLAAMGT